MANHTFNTDIAYEVGLEAAIILENIYFWCKKNEANNKLVNGKPFTYNSVKAFTEIFFYMSPSTISRSLKKLEESGFVETGVFNSNAYDRTKWYCITSKTRAIYDPKTAIENCEMQSAKSEDCICQNEKWSRQNDESNLQNEKSISQKAEMNIADINTDNKPNIITVTQARVCESVPDSELWGNGAKQKELYSLLEKYNESAPRNKKIAVSRDIVSFLSRENRELFSAFPNTTYDEAIPALKNYLQIASSETWKTSFSWRNFVKEYLDYTSEYFDESKYAIRKPLKKNEPKPVSEEFKRKLEEDAYKASEKERISKLRKDFNSLTPPKRRAAEKIFEMYQKSTDVYYDYDFYAFSLEFAEVADKLESVPSNVLLERFSKYFDQCVALDTEPDDFKTIVNNGLIGVDSPEE